MLPPVLAKLAFNLLVLLLEKTGILTGIEAGAVRAGDGFVRTVEHLKTYSNNDELNPAQSDFPSEVHNDGV